MKLPSAFEKYALTASDSLLNNFSASSFEVASLLASATTTTSSEIEVLPLVTEIRTMFETGATLRRTETVAELIRAEAGMLNC